MGNFCSCSIEDTTENINMVRREPIEYEYIEDDKVELSIIDDDD